MTNLKDLYGNECGQQETPTTRLLQRRDNRIQSEGKVWRYGGAAYPSVTHNALVDVVEQILKDAKAQDPEKRYSYKFTFEEVI